MKYRWPHLGQFDSSVLNIFRCVICCWCACRRGSIKDCLSFRSTFVGSGHALSEPVCLYLVHAHITTKTTCPARVILDDNRPLQFELQLSLQWPSQQTTRVPSERCKQIKETLHLTVTVTQYSLSGESLRRWILLTSVSLLDARRSSPGYNLHLGSQIPKLSADQKPEI